MTVLVGIFGGMGSGKSYEAVAFSIIPALRAGRTVATNLAGLFDTDKIKSTAALIGKDADYVRSRLIELPRVREELFAPGIFPDFSDTSRPALVPPGSLVVLDECSTVLSDKPPPHILRYVTEQRHGVDEHGNSGQMILISQSWAHLHKSVRDVIDVSYVCSTFKMLGPVAKFLTKFGAPLDYRSEVFTLPGQNPQSPRSKAQAFRPRRYDKRIFACYKSVNADESKALGFDSRATIFGNSFVMFVIPVAIYVMYLAASSLYERFGGAVTDSPAAALSPAPAPAPAPASPPRPLGSAAPAAAPVASGFYDSNSLSTEYELVGHYSVDGSPVYIVKDASRIHYVSILDVESVQSRGPRTTLKLKNSPTLVSYTQNTGGVSNASSQNKSILR